MTRHAVVTGGATGIGRAVAEALIRAGCTATLVGRDERTLSSAADQLGAACGWRRCDVTDEEAVSAVFAELGAVDILVNNAGVASSAPLGRTTLDEWEHQLRVNATGPFLCTRSVFDEMRRRGWGRIVTVASVAGVRGAAYVAPYVASKHAAVGLTRAVAVEAAGSGVTVNAVCPGYVRTDMTHRTVAEIVARTGRSVDQALEALVGSGRLVEPAEVADAVVWLAGEGAAAVNGEVIVIDTAR